ncbi:MAG: hypothetical protein KAT10_00395 [Sulfurimonas sp.]|nr:hypothetical protein [Sulfurimonas sp.]
MNKFNNKILAVLNDIEALDTVLKRAVSLSEEKEAILEVLFVHEEKIFGLPDFFRFKEIPEKDVADKDKIKKEIESKLTALGSKQEHIILVKIDDTVDRVLELTKGDEAITVIVQNHDVITKKLTQKENLDIVSV